MGPQYARERPPEDLEVVLPPAPSHPYAGEESPTGRRNPNVALMHQLIAVYDELDETHRELLVRIAHEVLAAQQRRAP